MAGPYERGYNDPAIAKSFDNLANMFAPPTPAQVYAGAKAQEARQKMEGIAAMYGLAQSADMSPEGKTRFDRYNAATGSGNIATGYYGVDQDNLSKHYNTDTVATTARRGQDIESGDRRYSVDQTGVRDKYKVDTESTDNRYKTDVGARTDLSKMYGQPVPKDAVAFTDPGAAKILGVDPGMRSGIVAAQPGEKNFIPGPTGAPGAGPVLEGNPKLPTESEAKAAVFGKLPQETQNRAVAGEHPAQVFTYPTGLNTQGTAVWDPVAGTMVDAQTKQPIPINVPVKNATNGTTVNVGPDGVGTPDKGFAFVTNPDGSKKIGANGAPIQVPMEGTPEFNKQKTAAAADVKNTQNTDLHNHIAFQDVDRALDVVTNHPNLSTGVGGQLTSNVGGTPGNNLHALLEGLKSNISLDRLQALRDSSPTGSALGRVTNQEVSMLAAAYGSLSQSQDPTQLADNLKRYKNILAKTVVGPDAPQELLSFEAKAELARRRGIAGPK